MEPELRRRWTKGETFWYVTLRGMWATKSFLLSYKCERTFWYVQIYSNVVLIRHNIVLFFWWPERSTFFHDILFSKGSCSAPIVSWKDYRTTVSGAALGSEWLWAGNAQIKLKNCRKLGFYDIKPLLNFWTDCIVQTRDFQILVKFHQVSLWFSLI